MAVARVCLPCRDVLSDCDGVLVDSDASVTQAWTRWALSYDLDPATVVPLVHGRRAADTVAMLSAPERRDAALARINAYEIEDAAMVVRCLAHAPSWPMSRPGFDGGW